MIRVLRRSAPRLLLALLLAIAVVSVAPRSVLAEGPGLQLTAEEFGDGTWRLRANVAAADGSVQSQVPVSFLAATDFFGDRWVPVGEALTDTSGAATLLYTPTWNGDQQLIARTSASDGALESTPLLIHVAGALPGVASEAEDLPIVRAWALPIGIAVVLVVWAVLGAIFISAVVGIVRRPATAWRPQSPPEVDGMETVKSSIEGGFDS